MTTIFSTDMESETSVLFNPAFCTLLLNKASANYEKKSGEALPVTFAFLILPSALHKPTREALPASTASSMWTWLTDHPVLLMDFAERVRTFRPLTAAAITYGLRHAVLSGTSGSISAEKLRPQPRTLFPTQDWAACVKAAEFLGRWYGGTGADEATTLAHWGVRP
ncbi:three component ABC system middle component [Paeniglutamicibacter sp. R2-26]|uniref:three component ABC system middle component n=1 Tax=Paeniglutamicibacter sp. R2-26 TaxID=3144417 RepID=UPI003EE789AD